MKLDGSMGAAAVRLPSNAEDKYEVQSSSFTGPISYTSAELRGLTLAQTLIRPVDDTTILTDSLASLTHLGDDIGQTFQATRSNTASNHTLTSKSINSTPKQQN